jgi:hypothetical protein
LASWFCWLLVDVDGVLKLFWNPEPRKTRVFIDKSAPFQPVMVR